MSHPEEPAELYLALRSGDTVRCMKCGGVVDFAQSCELIRGSDGRLRVTKCHTCLVAPQSSYSLPTVAWDIALQLVERYGCAGAKEEIEKLLALPVRGSRWIYTCPRTHDRLEFAFIQEFGTLLQFRGPFGRWTCSRDDWANYLASHRVRAAANVVEVGSA